MEICKVVKVKPWGKDQGDFVEINEGDFVEGTHELYEAEPEKEIALTKAAKKQS